MSLKSQGREEKKQESGAPADAEMKTPFSGNIPPRVAGSSQTELTPLAGSASTLPANQLSVQTSAAPKVGKGWQWASPVLVNAVNAGGCTQAGSEGPSWALRGELLPPTWLQVLMSTPPFRYSTTLSRLPALAARRKLALLSD